MNKQDNLPQHLRVRLQLALLGEINSHVRMIAVSFESTHLEIWFYLDRQPTEDDIDIASIVAVNLDAGLENNSEIRKISEKCVFSDQPKGKLNTFYGVVYSRNEDDWRSCLGLVSDIKDALLLFRLYNRSQLVRRSNAHD